MGTDYRGHKLLAPVFHRVTIVLNGPMKSRKAFQNDGNGGMPKLIAYAVAVY